MWLNIQNDGLGSYISGVLGLNLLPNYSNGYVPTLYDEGILEYPCFSVSLSNYYDVQTNYIDFGFIDYNSIDEYSEINWLDVYYHSYYGNYFWSLKMEGIRARE